MCPEDQFCYDEMYCASCNPDDLTGCPDPAFPRCVDRMEFSECIACTIDAHCEPLNDADRTRCVYNPASSSYICSAC